MKKILNESSNAGAINADTIDAQVFPSNPLSEKLIKYHCKTACIEDAMGVIKKAFQTDKIDLKEYLGHIRQLANKQCRTIIKIRKIIKLTQPEQQPQQMQQMQQQPGQGMPPMQGQQPMGMGM